MTLAGSAAQPSTVLTTKQKENLDGVVGGGDAPEAKIAKLRELYVQQVCMMCCVAHSTGATLCTARWALGAARHATAPHRCMPRRAAR